MTILDSGYSQELDDLGDKGTQTLAVVKKILKGICYADLGIAGGAVTGQMRTGDDQDLAGALPLVLRAYGTAPTIAVNTGTAVSGAGTATLSMLTDNSGAFAVTVTGSGTVILEIVGVNGVTNVLKLSL